MLYEIFKFELYYRLKRSETYLFFGFLLFISIFAVDFVFEGVDLGLVKKNAPIVTAKAMSAYTGIFMILVSMIMGLPIIRDDQHQITHLLYTTPISKFDLLVGRYLGSFVILVLIFCSMPIGMMIGESMPWRIDFEMGSFSMLSYLNSFTILTLPSLFFGGSLFYVTGALSRKLLVVYTQGIILFVIFILTKSITNEYVQAVLDPFSLTTTSYLSQSWSVSDKNTLLMPVNGVLLVNKMFWITLGVTILGLGYWRFNFAHSSTSPKSKKYVSSLISAHQSSDGILPEVTPRYGWIAHLQQWRSLSFYYSKSLLQEASFWAIVICAVVIIIINSISLGTVYDVDSYPTTYFIIAELQEMSFYFFAIIMLFYSGELYWKEHVVHLNQMTDTTPISTLVVISSKITGLVGIYGVLMIALIFSGVMFQLSQAYYHIDLYVYLVGFFVEILPVLILYTIAAFFFQALVHHKFLGILVTILFMIGTIAMQVLYPEYVLMNFASGSIKPYSEMNSYGESLKPFLWTQCYWGLLSLIILIGASTIAVRGVPTNLWHRVRTAPTNLSCNQLITGCIVLLMATMIGGYIYYQTHVLNEVWSEKQQMDYRVNYEKALKQFEYLPQPKITQSNLTLELYPHNKSYQLIGNYTLQNQDATAISEIHIQKQINADVSLHNVQFSLPVTIDSQYLEYGYLIYQLDRPLASYDSIHMSFMQEVIPQGWNIGNDMSSVISNGTFIRNNQFPTIGYNKKYELRDSIERASYGLVERATKASIIHPHELELARSGSDSRGVSTNVVIGTSRDQTAICSGTLTAQWQQGDRNYFRYQSNEPIIDFYAMLSGQYHIKKDIWNAAIDNTPQSVALEIYYHPRHDYNLDRMMASMKASLDYYSSQLSPYQYEQLRIVEFPRYEDFAQSFPTTIPFSESIGFMLDIDDAVDVDMTYFVTAHEVAHQWWGMQVEAANVQGQNFVLETLSQYSALMVLQRQYGQHKVDQFLTYQQERFELGLQKATVAEAPLYLVENEEHIYYNKGAIVMYELQNLIGEDEMNCALRLFIQDWNSKDGRIKSLAKRYATSEDLISYILNETPKQHLKHAIKLLYKT